MKKKTKWLSVLKAISLISKLVKIIGKNVFSLRGHTFQKKLKIIHYQ